MCTAGRGGPESLRLLVAPTAGEASVLRGFTRRKDAATAQPTSFIPRGQYRQMTSGAHEGCNVPGLSRPFGPRGSWGSPGTGRCDRGFQSMSPTWL